MFMIGSRNRRSNRQLAALVNGSKRLIRREMAHLPPSFENDHLAGCGKNTLNSEELMSRLLEKASNGMENN